MSDQNNHRIVAIAAIAGALLLFVGTLLHPMHEDPNNSLAAFGEYAENGTWVASHLTQFAGILLMMLALVLLSRLLAGGPGAGWAIMGAAGATASLAVAGALQAVDGIALKAMVDRWAVAPSADKAILFYTAFGVRQIEVGLASIFSLLGGITVIIFGQALLADRAFPRWLGWLAILGGAPTALAGMIMAYTGFSELTMNVNMPANFLLLVWAILLGAYIWRLAPKLSNGFQNG